MFIDLTERGREREGGRERERERNIAGLPPTHPLTKDRTHKLLVCGMMPQLTEPPNQGWEKIFLVLKKLYNKR